MKYPKKSLGQNFLIDKNIINKIINVTNIYNKNVIEIGPGKGALTKQILSKKPKSLILIEKDSLLFDELKKKFQNNKKIKILNKDILKLDLEKEIKQKSIIYGNLPYNISSQILVKFIRLKKNSTKYSQLIFMFQKEMAERITGKYKSSKYGRLAILSNYNLKIKQMFKVSPNCFFPKPKIISTVLSFRPYKSNYNIKNVENLEKITSIFFSSRRKMINKVVNKIFDKIIIKKLFSASDLRLRPEELKPGMYYKITEFFEKI